MGKGMPHRFVECDPTLQEDLLAYVAQSLDLSEVIVGDGVNQPGYDVLPGITLL
jgi:hypothetical protein